MKGILMFFVGLLLAWTSHVDARGVRVSGYVKKDGTYVAPHYRSVPNRSALDNYSTRGNYNPYTGQSGKNDPYALPATRGAYGSGYAPSVPTSTYAQPVYQAQTVHSGAARYRLAESGDAWPRFNTPATTVPSSVEGASAAERYGVASATYLMVSSGSLCNEFLLAADEVSRAAEILAKCASRMDPRLTCAVEADDAMQSSIRYQVSASKAQSHCRRP
ncbi:UNVERIFIED_ORG: hypothetical protein M2420_002101 [Stenotrophomonas maltophilia]|jgi:hypothetical protein